jgi:hypothetical protein
VRGRGRFPPARASVADAVFDQEYHLPWSRPVRVLPRLRSITTLSRCSIIQQAVRPVRSRPFTRARRRSKWPNVKTVEALTVTTATADLAHLGMGVPGDLGEEDLHEVGFADGYVRRWIDKHDTYVTVRIYRFDHAGGGVEFADNKVGGAEADVWGEARRNIKDDPNAASFVQPKTRRGLQEALVAGGFSDIAILVTTPQRPPAAATVAKSVFSDEHRKL